MLLTREVTACVIRAEDEDALYQSICRVIVERGGYLLAAIFALRQEEQRIEVLHAQGQARDYLKDIDIRLDDSPAGRGPSPQAARTGQAVAINDVATDPRHAYWNERARPYGIQSMVSIPLKVRGQVRWLLTIYAGKPNAFDPVEVELLELLASDVAYGIEALRTRRERDQAALLARQATHRMELAAHGAGIGIWEYRLASREPAWDRQTYRLFGHEPEGGLGPDEIVAAALGSELHQRLRAQRNQCIRTQTLFEMELPARLPDGSTRWLMTRARPETTPKGVPSHLIGVIFDVTDQVQARSEQAARRAAEDASQAKSEFISHMSHELRTPLNAVLGFSALMRRDPGITAAQRRHLQIIHRSGEHLLGLVNSILDMSKIEAGRMALELSAFDLDALVGDVTDMMRARAQEKGLGLVLDVQEKLVRHLQADPAKLRQIIINLLSNAIKFTDYGSVRMQLRQHRDEQGRLQLTIQVQDSGVGLHDQDVERIFEPFVQVGTPSTQGGTGLGLAITRQFIALMGGNISVRSSPGKGSTFQVNLPVTEAAAADVPEAAPASGDIAGLAPDQPRWRILVMEDRQDNALLMTRLLEEVGFDVRVALHAGAGIDTFRQWQPHLIWMDLNMPGMDGLQATQHLRTLPGGSQVRIALVTAATLDAQQQAQMTASGVDALVRKPYPPQEIYDCMARLLGVRYVQRQHDAPQQSAPTETLATQLKALPLTLRRTLWDALISLDARRIDAVIAQAAQSDGALGELLARHAAQYQYTPILAALEKHMKPPTT